MKTKITIIVMILIAITAFDLKAQNNLLPVRGGEVLVPQNSQPCLTEPQRSALFASIAANRAQLEAEGRLLPTNTEGGHPLFDWPVAQASGFNYNTVWSVSNYIDHNPAFPDQISDYDCGTRSYDTSNGYNHKGFDIISWPFWWKQMDLNQAINVAAADGQILDKNDGSFDRNCTFNGDTPNYIALQHDDGSVSWYLHMKDGGLTSKGIGDSVSQGEFLGVIGSSGSSTIPHSHFEVYDSANNLIDPSIGACNNLNSDTWWNDQKPYYDPAINAVLTHTDWPNFETCPNTEITNESNQFDLGDNVFYGVYLKDQQADANIHLKVTRPDSSIQQEFDFAPTDAAQIAYYMWIFEIDMEGVWTWEATYEGDSATHTFNVGALGIEDNKISNTTVYPNPLEDTLFIDSESNINEVIFRDVTGRTIFQLKDTNSSIKEVDVSSISHGIYFITLTSEANKTKNIKLIKD